MELQDYTTKELREELKRRIAIAKEQKAKEQKAKERKQKPICDNCKHCIIRKVGSVSFYYCGAKTYTQKGITRNYTVNKGNMCRFNLFEHK